MSSKPQTIGFSVKYESFAKICDVFILLTNAKIG